jgi:hypothetical protein
MRKSRLFKKASIARWVIREVLAVAFWVHAFCIFGLIPLPQPVSPDLVRYCFNALLVVFIINYSLFSDRGWLSVAFDLLYIYFLPIIYVGKLCFLIARLSFKTLRSRAVWQNPQMLVDSARTTGKSAKTAEPKTDSSEKEPTGTTFYTQLGRLLFKFSLLWAFLSFTINSKPGLFFVAIVSLIGAWKAVFGLWGMFSGRSTWVEKVETALNRAIEHHSKRIASWDGVSNPGEIRSAINAIRFYGAIFSFVSDNSPLLKSWAFATSILISVPFYCYISFLFSCAYLSIAKIVGLKFPWSEAFVDSLFMPFAWSALPPNILIKLIAGLQATCVSIIGYNVLFRHLGNRLDAITKIATSLRGPLQREEFKLTIGAVESKLSAGSATQDTEPVLKGSKGKRRKSV